jgi:hypothetical protein
MYGHEGSATLAATGTGLVIFGGYVDTLQLLSVAVGLALIGTATLLAFRKTRRRR